MSERAERVVFWALAAALVGGAVLSWALLVGRGPGSASVPVAAAASEPDRVPVRLLVTALSGEVTRVRHGAAAPLRPGDAVRAGDALETPVGARLELAGGPFAIALEEASRVHLEETAGDRARLRVERGLAAATVREPGAAVEIASGRDAVASATAGTLSVSRCGTLVAAAMRGAPGELRAAGAVARLRDGDQATAADGAPPAGAAPIPLSLALRVDWPRGRRVNAPRVSVQGATAPGALLVVVGEPVAVAPDGTFAAEVPLRAGAQQLSARAAAVGGLRATADGPVLLVDDRPPEARFDTRGLWNDR
jgi:hypothetical protein